MPKKLIVFDFKKAVDQIINNLRLEKELSENDEKMLKGFIFGAMSEKELKAVDTYQKASAFFATKLTEVKKK